VADPRFLGLPAPPAETPALSFSPERLDLQSLLNGDYVDPDYLVDGLLVRGETTLISGDTGAGKTWVAHSLAVAVVNGGSWLDRRVKAGTVIYIDEENPLHVVVGRLRAFGLDEHAASRLHYFERNGARLGDGGQTDAWLRSYAEEHQPDLILVDTAMAATAITEVNDNTAVVRLVGTLRELAKTHNCAVVVLHHERKNQHGRSNRSQATMGARQWIGQQDLHLIVWKAENQQQEKLDGNTQTHELVLGLSYGKLRHGVEPPDDRLVLRTVNETDGGRTRLMSAELSRDNERRCQAAESILAALRDSRQPVKTAALAEAVGLPPQNSTFKRTLKRLCNEGQIEKRGQGLYQAAPSNEVPL